MKQFYKINTTMQLIIYSLLFGFIFNRYLFKHELEDFFLYKKYFDFGPTIYNGNNPDIEMYFYILFIALSFIFLLISWWISKSNEIIITNNYLKNINFTFIVIVCLLFITPLYAKTEISMGYLIIFLLTILFSSLVKNHNFFVFLNVLLSLFFLIVFYYHIPKMSVLIEIFVQAGRPKLIFGLLSLLLLSMFLLTMYIRNRPLRYRLIIFFIFVMIFYICIKEYPITWGIDSFHEGEGILNAHYFYNNSYTYYENFFPIHGFFRNTIPSYVAGLFSDNNLYLVRVITSFYNSFFITVVIFLIYRFSNLSSAIAFFLLNYTYALFNPLDISPFFLIGLICLTFARKNSKYLFYIVGIFVGLDSLYSYEFMIFYFIAFTFISTIYFYKNRFIKSSTRDIICGFLIVWIITLIFLNIHVDEFFKYLVELLKMSPNLLDRPLEFPKNQSYYYLIIYVLVPLFIFFYILKPTEYILLNKTNKYSFAISIISFVSLMYFTRAFNRSDDGHVMQGLYIFVPLFVAFTLKISKYNRKLFLLFVIIVLGSFVYSQKLSNKNLFEFLKQGSYYDKRLTLESIPKGGHFGSSYVPLLSINSLASTDELEGINILKQNNYKLFDYTNQPFLIYGMFGFELTNPDMYTIFSNTLNQQKNIIENLSKSDKTIILFSSGHWSETLDNTYQEYRLPIVSKYISTNYKFKYKIGRFVLLSKEKLPFLIKYEKFDNSDLISSYNLGMAPSRMTHYKEENIVFELKEYNSLLSIDNSVDGIVITTDNIKGNSDLRLIFKKNDSFIFDIKFKLSEQLKENFIRFSNLALFNRNDINNLVIESNNCEIKDVKIIKLNEK